MRVRRYVLEKVLGSGSMGIVYRAHDRVLGRTVAIKTIRKELISKDSEYRAYRDRFFREAHIFGSLSHPNIVALYDVGETDDGLPYLTMEYVPDASLGTLDRRLSLDQVMWLLAQIASGIDYAHSREILHRTSSRRTSSWAKAKKPKSPISASPKSWERSSPEARHGSAHPDTCPRSKCWVIR